MPFFGLALTMWPYLRADVNYPQIEVISIYDSKSDKHKNNHTKVYEFKKERYF